MAEGAREIVERWRSVLHTQVLEGAALTPAAEDRLLIESVAAALQAERRSHAGVWPAMCDGCFYSAWVPVPTETECALVHPHEGEHVRCDYCWLKEQFQAERQEIE